MGCRNLPPDVLRLCAVLALSYVGPWWDSAQLLGPLSASIMAFNILSGYVSLRPSR